VEDEPRSGRPASLRTSTKVDRVRAFIRQDRRLTIRKIADEIILMNVRSTKLLRRFEHENSVFKYVAKNLNDNQKARRNKVSAEMLERLEIETDFLNPV
jgi:hypothetical protein